MSTNKKHVYIYKEIIKNKLIYIYIDISLQYLGLWLSCHVRMHNSCCSSLRSFSLRKSIASCSVPPTQLPSDCPMGESRWLPTSARPEQATQVTQSLPTPKISSLPTPHHFQHHTITSNTNNTSLPTPGICCEVGAGWGGDNTKRVSCYATWSSVALDGQGGVGRG